MEASSDEASAADICDESDDEMEAASKVKEGSADEQPATPGAVAAAEPATPARTHGEYERCRDTVSLHELLQLLCFS